MRRLKPLTDLDDDGSSSLEFIVTGVLLLVPIFYMMLVFGQLQQQTLGAEAAARQIARAVATAANVADADVRADRVLATIASEYGTDASDIDVTVVCPGVPGACPAPGATLLVTVRVEVQLPLVPAILGLDQATTIPVEATAGQKVSRLWGAAG